MHEMNFSGGLTSTTTHYTGRELPYLTDISGVQGTVKSVSLSGSVRFGSGVTSATVYPVIFKTFTMPTTWVDERTRYRQNTNNGTYYITIDNWETYCSNALIKCGAKTLTYSQTGNQSFYLTFTGSEITSLGMSGSNWNGERLIIGLLPQQTGINWGNGTSFILTIETILGTVVYYYNGSEWKSGTPYYWNGTEWQQCSAKYYNGTSWIDC